jgi:ketosteroid isomerase-like protein
MSDARDQAAVLFANEAFYRAFADRDLGAMEALWAADGPIACIHPGWPALASREEVLASWARILANPDAPKVACERPRAFVLGETAFVICYEAVERTHLVATNVFRRAADGAWKLVHHQAGPSPPPPGPRGPAARPRMN